MPANFRVKQKKLLPHRILPLCLHFVHFVPFLTVSGSCKRNILLIKCNFSNFALFSVLLLLLLLFGYFVIITCLKFSFSSSLSPPPFALFGLCFPYLFLLVCVFVTLACKICSLLFSSSSSSSNCFCSPFFTVTKFFIFFQSACGKSIRFSFRNQSNGNRHKLQIHYYDVISQCVRSITFL